MEASARYCTSEDGTRIANSMSGEGFPVVILTPFIHTFTLEGTDFSRVMTEAGRSVLRYDGRGTGLSQRAVTEFSLNAKVSDLEAVVNSAGLARFDLYGIIWSGPVAIAYAERHPERVDHLLLYGTAARAPWPWSQLKPLIDLASTNWVLASQLFADFSDRDADTDPIDADLAGRTAAMFRESADGGTVAEFMSQGYAIDVMELLPNVKTPTLVLHRRSDRTIPLSSAEELAAQIPNSTLVVLEGTSLTFSFRDEDAWKATEDFLRLPGLASSTRTGPAWLGGASRRRGATAVILFADIADSTTLTERLGDAAFREKARALDEALRKAITSNGGTAIDGKLLGDGVLVTFGAAREAIACAQACHAAAKGVKLALHIGVHAGDVIRESNNVYGGAVNIAARVASEAAAGETLVSTTVRDLARTSAGVAFEDRGERELKGVSEPVRVFAVRLD